MQTALAAARLCLHGAAEGQGLVLQGRTAGDSPPLTIATLRTTEDGVELRWGDGDVTMTCAPAAAFTALLNATAAGDDIPLDGMTLRRLWP